MGKSYTEDSIESFRRFIQRHLHHSPGDPDYEYLQDYLYDWLESDNGGLDGAGGNFSSYLLAVISIIDAWLKDPSILYRDGEPRTVSGVISDDGYGHMFVEEQWFDRLAFARMRRERT